MAACASENGREGLETVYILPGGTSEDIYIVLVYSIDVFTTYRDFEIKLY